MRSFFRARRPFKLTKGGWIFILYTIGVGAGAINTGNNLLYLVFGLFLGLILASGVLSDLTLWGLEAVAIPPKEGRAGEPLIFPIAVRNAKTWFPSLGIRLEVRGVLNKDTLSALSFRDSIKSGRLVDTVPVFQPQSRGQLLVNSIIFSTRFPFGLLSKFWIYELSSPVEALVLPRLLENESDVFFSPAEAALADQTAARRGEGPTLFGIREFQSADNPKRIHWKASAKRSGGWPMEGSSGWLIREMEEEESETVHLRWPVEFGGIDEKEFEHFVSFVATLVEKYESRRLHVVLIGGETPVNWRLEGESLRRFLAMVRPEYLVENGESISGDQGAFDLFRAYRASLGNKPL